MRSHLRAVKNPPHPTPGKALVKAAHFNAKLPNTLPRLLTFPFQSRIVTAFVFKVALWVYPAATVKRRCRVFDNVLTRFPRL